MMQLPVSFLYAYLFGSRLADIKVVELDTLVEENYQASTRIMGQLQEKLVSLANYSLVS